VIERIGRDRIRRLAATPIDGITTQAIDEMAIPSYLHWNPLIRWLMWKRYDAVLALADLRPEMTVLEFGCGLGLLLPTLAAHVRRVYAIDLFPQYAQRLAAESGARIHFVRDLGEIDDGRLDVVIAADVMEHLEAPKVWAARFRSKLTGRGRLIVSGPTETVPYRIGRVLAGFGTKGDYHHTNIDRLKADILASGFRLRGERRLPFRVPPYLFKILAFDVDG
jgi:2-polyprenyl-3-methyl-5-hydroxy-6-metoxy-1,4-benzoquinol methylase